MTQHAQHLDLGHAAISPRAPVVAGSYATITYTYTTGHPIDDTGAIRIAFRFASDFGTPQFDRPADPDYCALRTTGDCRLEPRWDPKGNTRPWGRTLYIKVMAGYLDRGDQVIVVFGDRSGGSPGWRVQSFCERTFEFKTLVDPIATYEFKELPRSPELEIIPGPPAKAVCIAPSQVLVGEPIAYHLKLEDRWGNPTGDPIPLSHPGNGGPGIHFLTARDHATNLEARSNPIDVIAGPTALRPFWADFHGQSEETIGSNTIQDYFTFARDMALIDIGAHQGNDFQVTDPFWATVNETAAAFNRDGRFVTFPGYEWSANTPLGGDRNVYYAGEGGAIVHSCFDLLPGKTSRYPMAVTAGEMFSKLDGPAPFAFAHVGGRYADLRMHDPDIEIAVEIHSAWGTFEWLLEDALELGYRIGICANSDGHKGRPGASYPGARSFGSYGGLTCVLAERLDRASVLAALRARHFFATTGHRPGLSVTLVTGDGREAMMGDAIEAGNGVPVLRVRAVGTAPIESITVRDGLRSVVARRTYRAEELGKRIKVVWSGAEVRGRARMTRWDGALELDGNRIAGVTPINFWNPLQPLRQTSPNRLAWQSVTTGGLAGAIIDLGEGDSGHLCLDTLQGQFRCDVAEIGYTPTVWPCGGLRKQIQAYRLPDKLDAHCIEFDLPLSDLAPGDNPIYVRVDQMDGHMAWSSPIYLVR